MNEKIIKTEVVNVFLIKEIFENGNYRHIEYYDKEHIKIKRVQYYNSKNQYHRDNDLPSYIRYWNNGNIENRMWEQNNNYHRLTGPAWINYDKNGKVVCEYYYIDEKELSKEEWQKEVNLYKNLKIFLK